MSDNTHIEWTDATWNIITGCTLLSEGCRHCYAATLAVTRLKHIPSRAGLARINAVGEAKFTGEVRFNQQWLDQPLRWKKPRRIFVCAHGDLFHENVPDEWIDKVFAVMALCPRHTFQVLTKRPERMATYFAGRRANFGRASEVLHKMDHPCNEDDHDWAVDQLDAFDSSGRLMHQVWLGTSVEDQATAEARVPHLLATPASVRFVSAEPLLGPVDFRKLSDENWTTETLHLDATTGFTHNAGFVQEEIATRDGAPLLRDLPPRLDWVVVGGESGRGARPMHPDWARSIRDQCQAAGVAFFFKQWGAWAPISFDDLMSEEMESLEIEGKLHGFADQPMLLSGKARAGRLLDGREWNQMPGLK